VTVIDIVNDIAPEFDVLGVDLIERFIGYAECSVNADFFGCDYELAWAYMTAHMLELRENRKGSSGYASLKKEGDLQLQYIMPAGISGQLATTSYGAEFIRLRNKYAKGAFCAAVIN